MLKKLSAFILLLTFSIQTLSAQFMALDYYLNTSAYAKNCINKARPALNCNGKCQFMKKVAQHEKKEQQNQEGKSSGKNETSLSSKSFYTTAPFIFRADIDADFPEFQDNSTIDISSSFFHPPGL